ncbi:hypothetical protein BDZ91DRAFT_743155 [Kalaharituber pfeilii]|nr:hypothetical protein BDZ91DRAFT_743155 [Kalaharituber pfeilii]
MPLDFGKDCPHHVYLNGENTEVHFGDGSLLYTIEIPKSTRGTGVSNKLLKDKEGKVKYILTQERNKEDIYEPPVYFISAVRPEEGGKVFKAGYGHIGRVFQNGYEICVSFRNTDSSREKASLSTGMAPEAPQAPEAPRTDAVPGADVEGQADASSPSEEEGGVVKRFFSRLLGWNKKQDRFVALVYDGRSKWVYLGSNIPGAPDAAAAEGATTAEKEKDIVLAHKEAEDEKKGFLGLRAVTMEPGNEWLRDMVIAAWLVVLWEEDRWSRLPASLKAKGLEYLGGRSGPGVNVQGPLNGGTALHPHPIVDVGGSC